MWGWTLTDEILEIFACMHVEDKYRVPQLTLEIRRSATGC